MQPTSPVEAISTPSTGSAPWRREKLNWAAGKTHLVQIGDVLDRGPDSRKAMDLLMKLEGQAADAGGAVHPLIGNHEAMVLLNDWRYVHPAEELAFGGAEAYRKHLLEQHGIGVIADGETDIRVAFSAVELDDLEELYGTMARAARELQG